MEQNRDFKGIWFPREVWLDTRLSALDKIILLEIDSLDNEETGCFASNEYLADFCQCSVTKVSLGIKKLIDIGYIYVESFNGRTRILKSRLSKNERQTFNNCEADFQNLLVENNNKDIIKENNINNLKNNINSLKENIKKENPISNLEAIFSYWNDKNIIKHREINKDIEKAYQKAIKEFELNDIFKAIDRYATVLNDTNYYFNYKWTLSEFLKQSNCIKDFLDDGSKWVNYQNKNKNLKGHQISVDEQSRIDRAKVVTL